MSKEEDRLPIIAAIIEDVINRTNTSSYSSTSDYYNAYIKLRQAVRDIRAVVTQ